MGNVPKSFVSAMSRNKNWHEALSETASQIKKGLNGASCDLLLVFVSETFDDFDATSSCSFASFCCNMTAVGNDYSQLLVAMDSHNLTLNISLFF